MTRRAAAVQLMGFSHDGTPYPMFIALIACAAGALFAYAGIHITQRRPAPVAA